MSRWTKTKVEHFELGMETMTVKNNANTNSRCKRQGFSLPEVLIATAVSLIMMAALAQGFKRLADSMTSGRARLTLSDRLRGVSAILRSDLENCTVRPTPPIDGITSVGYFEYLDGPVTDFSSTVYNFITSGIDNNGRMPTNRFGDTDDVLMLTVKASGEPFKGKVPLAIVKGRNNQGLAVGDPGYLPIVDADWNTFVVISSEYAEVAYFVLPVLVPDATGSLVDVTTEIPNFRATKSAGFPDEFRLYRRVLLIRPDLNLNFGLLSPSPCLYHATDSTGTLRGPFAPRGANIGNDGATSQNVESLTAMALAFQQCDLSMRRVLQRDSGSGYNHYACAANSLEDLMLRENRFAHSVIRLPSASPTMDSSMPIMALTTALPRTGISAVAGVRSTVQFTDYVPRFSGYLRPEFALGGARIGEDILLSGVTAFDIKGYDPSVALAYHLGPDGAAGSIGVDDDNDGNTDFVGTAIDLKELGSRGSDDSIISPNDPAYAGAMASTAVPKLGQGEFVDLCWGIKIKSLMDANSLTSAVGGSLWTTPLSGYFANPYSSSPNDNLFSVALRKSGLIIRNVGLGGTNASGREVFQPTYDSWTSAYETDDQFQSLDGVTNRDGTVWANGWNYFWNQGSYSPASDARAGRGTNGIDDPVLAVPANGLVDDDAEKETNPPFLIALPAVQIQIRAEDSGTSTLLQSSVVQDFSIE